MKQRLLIPLILLIFTPKNVVFGGQGLEVRLRTSKEAQSLLSWEAKQFLKLKWSTFKEKGASYRGVLLSDFLDQSMASLSVAQRAQIDLLIFKNIKGREWTIPRAWIIQYPVRLGITGEKFSVWIPSEALSQLAKQGKSKEDRFFEEVESVDLTSTLIRYAPLFLARRTDPSAIRGEKLFVQNCAECHASGMGPAPRQRTLASVATDHEKHAFLSRQEPRALRALESYLESHRMELSADRIH